MSRMCHLTHGSLHFRAQTAFDEHGFGSVPPSQLVIPGTGLISILLGEGESFPLFLSVHWRQMNTGQESVSTRCYNAGPPGRCWHCPAWAGKEAPYNNRDSTWSLGIKLPVPFGNCNERFFAASPLPALMIIYGLWDCREPPSGRQTPSMKCKGVENSYR